MRAFDRVWVVLTVCGMSIGCIGADDRSVVRPSMDDPSAVDSEVQRVFDDAACYCESYLLLPYDPSRGSTAPTSLQARALSVREATTFGDVRLTRYIEDTPERNVFEGGPVCSLSSDAARGALSDRTWQNGDEIVNGCTGWPSSSASHAFCRAEIEHCIGQELRLAAASSTHPLPEPVRVEVLAEAERRFQSASVGALAELTRLRTSGCPYGTIDPDCLRQGGYERAIHLRVGDATSAMLSARDAAIRAARIDSDVVTPAQVEGTGFAAATYGPSSARVAILQRTYGATPVAEWIPTPPPSAGPVTGISIVPMPSDLRADSFQSPGIRMMLENENLVLPSDLALPGGRVLRAGTAVNVYLAHYDPAVVGEIEFGVSATIGFADRSVQGVLASDAQLAATDAILGRPGVSYPATSGRGLETTTLRRPDSLSVSASGVTVTAISGSLGSVDQLRIVTLAAPDEPETVVAAERGGDLPRAARTYGDARTQRALELLAQYRIALPHVARLDGLTGEVTDARWIDDASSEAGRMYDDLEAALRADASRPPRAADEPYLVDRLHGLRVSDVADALDLLRDVEATLDGIVLAPATPGEGRSILHPSAPTQRGILPLLASFARAGTGTLLGGTGSWYQPSADQLTRIGSTGAAQMLRARIAIATPGDPETLEAANDSLALIDEEIGSSWTEWRLCDPGAPCEGDASGAQWSIFERRGEQLPRGVAVLVSTESDARCLLHGHEPLAPAGADCAHVVGDPARYRELPEVTTGLGTLGCEIGFTFGPYCRRSFTATGLGSLGPNESRHVLWCAREPGDAAGSCRSYELVDVVYPAAGPQVHAFGGDTAAEIAEMLAVDPTDPAFALFNSLGFERGFVPPLENELTDDGDAHEDSWESHLRAAERTGTEAAALLESARQHELEQLAYERTVEAQLASAALAQQETVSSLCGADVPEADCSLERIPRMRLGVEGDGVPGLGVISSPGPAPEVTMRGVSGTHSCLDVQFIQNRIATTEGENALSALRALVVCTRWNVLYAFSLVEITDLPVAVYEEVITGGGGTFAQYGGEQRRQLIALYQEIEDLRASMRSFETLAANAQLELDALGERFARIDGPGWTCQLKAFGRGVAAIASVAAAVVAVAGTGGAALPALVFVGGAITTQLTMHEALDQCGDADNEQREIVAEATIGVNRAIDGMVTMLDEARRTVGTVAEADSRFDDMDREIELARRRREIAERLATSGVAGDPTWRALLGVERRRADDALARAQRYAFVARRAIEVRLAEDLGAMTSEETFVAAPAFWADDVFDLGNAVEYVEVDGDVVAVDTRAEAITDYLNALRSFVDGYPISRRFSEGDDLQVVNLAEVVEIDPALLPPGTPPTEAPLVSRLLFQCRSAPAPLVGGVPAGTIVDPLAPPEPCGTFDDGAGGTIDLGGVDHAVLSFSIPSGLDGGYFGERLAGGNFNYRVRQVSMNLVGRALFDCESAERPTECYGDGNVQYSMRQQGATIITSWDGVERLYAFEPGVITRARALADERWLTNPLSGSDTALLAPYQRDEWWGRPLAGTYTIEIEDRPGMVWQNLENVQVLLHYHYWTQQR